MNPTILSYLQLIRAPAVFTALSNILAAQLILTQGEINWAGLALLLGSSATLYSGGMALNDWFDYAEDLQRRPSRPLPAGKLPRLHALLFAGLLLISGTGLAALAGSRSMYIALAIVALVFLYNGALKRTYAGSLVMGGCRYLNWLLGFSLLPLTELSLTIPITVFLYITTLTLLSQQEETAEHRKIIFITITGIVLTGLSIIGIAIAEGSEMGWNTLFVIIGCGFICQRLWLCYCDFSPSSVQTMMELLIFAIIPLDALLVMVFGPSWSALAVLALLLPGKFLARMMYVT